MIDRLSIGSARVLFIVRENFESATHFGAMFRPRTTPLAAIGIAKHLTACLTGHPPHLWSTKGFNEQ